MLDAQMRKMGYGIKRDEYAISDDGMRMFGIIDLEDELDSDSAFSLGIRNSNDKRFSLGMTGGYRVFVCDNMSFAGDFQPVFRKHTSGISLDTVIRTGLERFEKVLDPMRVQVKRMKSQHLDADTAKAVIYDAFTSDLALPKALLPQVHERFFNDKWENDEESRAFEGRTLWSLSNAFTSSMKTLSGMRQFQETGRLAEFLKRYESI